eukprot:310839_1
MSIQWYEAMGCEETDNECYSRWTDIHYAAIIPSVVSFCCSLSIIIMTLMYLKKFREITFGAKLPMLISICDAGFHLIHCSDHIHNLSTKHLPSDISCKFLGSMMSFFINGQTIWAIAIAFFVNYCVRNAHSPQDDYKYFNIILHCVCWGIPSIILIFGYAFNVYGIEGPWCGIVDPDTHLLMLDLWILIADCVLIVVYSWTGLYIYKIVSYIQKQRGTDDDMNNRAVYGLQKIKKTMQSLPWFPVVYVTQWSVYLLWTFVLERTWTLTMLVVIIGNCGGMMNFIVFLPLLINPVKKAKRSSMKPNSNVTQLATVTNSTNSQ